MHERWHRGLAAVAVLALLAGCAPVMPSSAPSVPVLVGDPTPTPTPAPTRTPAATPAPAAAPAADRSGFAEAARHAFAAMLVRLDRQMGTPTPAPECNPPAGSADFGEIVNCSLAVPTDDPDLTLFVSSTNSVVLAGMMLGVGMTDDSMMLEDDGGRVGERSIRYSNREADGCKAVAAARDGTVALSIALRLRGEGADCTADAVFERLEAAERLGFGVLAPYRHLGVPVNDPAGRNEVVRLIRKGALKPGARDLVKLPAEYVRLSDSGEVVAWRDGKAWTIVFFEVRGLVDGYSAWVYRSSGSLSKDEDPLGSIISELERIDAHWFHIVSH